MPAATVIANLVLFQVAWFASVLGAARGLPWVGVAVVALVAALHLARARMPARELRLLALSLAIGALFESLLVRAGLLRFDAGALAAGTAPIWMVALWANFATTLNVSLRPLRGRWLAASLLGAIGAPMAYNGGQALGAVQMVNAAKALAVIAGGWAILTPLLFLAARRFDGYARR